MYFNLNGTILNLSKFEERYQYDVHVQRTKDGDGLLERVHYSGYSINLLQELSRLLNFTWRVSKEVDAYEHNKTFTHSIDIFAFAQSTELDEDSRNYVMPSFGLGISQVSAFFNHAFEGSSSSVLLGPFEPALWLSLVAFFAITSSAFVLLGWLERVPIGFSYMTSIATFLQRDTGFKFNRFPARWNMAVCGLASLIIYTTYSGNFYSLLTFKTYSINSLSALADSDFNIYLDVGYNNDSVVQKIAESMTNNINIVKILEKAAKSNFVFESFEKALERALKSPEAYIIDNETAFWALLHHIGTVSCSFGSIPIRAITYPWVWFIRKDSPHFNALNYGITRLHETGLRKRAWKLWIPSNFDCTPEARVQGIGISQIIEAFYIAFSGIAISFAIYLCEKYIWRIISEANKKNPNIKF